MPVDFLTDEQANKYGRFAGEPTPEQLSRFFHLDDNDRSHVLKRRGDHNRLGFALQLCTVRFLGTFLAQPTDVPEDVIAFLARQLGVGESSCLQRYVDRRTTRHDHANEIKQLYGYVDFHDQPGHFRLVRWLYTRSWLTAERPSVLFDLATARLVEAKVLLPGVSTLSKLVAQIRDRTSKRLWRALSIVTNASQRERLNALLEVPEGSRQSNLDRLRRSPTRVSGPALVAALDRLEEIRSVGAGGVNLQHVPESRIQALARYAAATWAPKVTRMSEQRRIATLLSFAHVFEATAMDDAMDVLDMLITEITHSAELNRKKERLRTIRDLDTAALRLREACQVLLDDTYADLQLRETIFAPYRSRNYWKLPSSWRRWRVPRMNSTKRSLLIVTGGSGGFFRSFLRRWNSTRHPPVKHCPKHSTFSATSRGKTDLT